MNDPCGAPARTLKVFHVLQSSGPNAGFLKPRFVLSLVGACVVVRLFSFRCRHDRINLRDIPCASRDITAWWVFKCGYKWNFASSAAADLVLVQFCRLLRVPRSASCCCSTLFPFVGHRCSSYPSPVPVSQVFDYVEPWRTIPWKTCVDVIPLSGLHLLGQCLWLDLCDRSKLTSFCLSRLSMTASNLLRAASSLIASDHLDQNASAKI